MRPETRTAESVSPKHPDKICDQVSDAILDEILRQDEYARVAIETFGGHGKVVVAGEVTTRASVDYREIARRISGVDLVQVRVQEQSNFIASGVDAGGAGDQGIMVGYACNDTKSRMPLEVVLARSLCQRVYAQYPYDGKTQVTVRSDKIVNVTVSFQNTTQAELKAVVDEWLWAISFKYDGKPSIYLNPAGNWSLGGFDADTGLTGRKIVVDSYGPFIPVGGGAFSGKDPTKVDRSGAYMARFLAVELQRIHGASEVYTYLSYAIGKAQPTMSLAVIDGKPSNIIEYDLRPEAIIERLDLRKPQYLQTAKWGHFGNGFLWDGSK